MAEGAAGADPLWDFPGTSAGVDCHFLLQGIFLTQELNPGLLHGRQILYQLSYSPLLLSTFFAGLFTGSLGFYLCKSVPF